MFENRLHPMGEDDFSVFIIISIRIKNRATDSGINPRNTLSSCCDQNQVVKLTIRQGWLMKSESGNNKRETSGSRYFHQILLTL